MMSQAAVNPEARATMTDRRVLLRAHGVKKTYQMGDAAVLVLKGIDFSLREGEFVAIEGRSGSGKSTFLHILGGLDGADQGKLEYDGRVYAQDTSSGRRFPLIPIWAHKWEMWFALVAGWL